MPYHRIVTEQFAHLPAFLVKGIHSESLRALVENGLLGLLAFVLALLRTVHFAILSGGSGLAKTEWCGYQLFLAAALILLAVKSSGTKLLVPYVIVAFLRDLVRRLAPVPDPRPAYRSMPIAPRRTLGLLGPQS
jgi:hypothetical protein